MEQPAAAPGRRRRRRRPKRAPDVPAAEAIPVEATPTPEPVEAAANTKPRRRKPGRDAPGERGLRDIVGAGRSQLGVSGALRARDVNRPTDADLDEAERDIAIVRRNWKPPG